MSVGDPQPGSLEDMVRAVEAVRERLLRATEALASAGVPYGVIGANAVAHWVAKLDEGAVRNTPNVDILIRREDLDRAAVALQSVRFVTSSSDGAAALFLDPPKLSVRQAVRLWCCGDVLAAGCEPLPDVDRTLPTWPFRVASQPALVQMKLSAFRTIDRVHLQDMARVGLIDATWENGLPEELAERLRQILANPDA
jgi:hypothetical protein